MKNKKANKTVVKRRKNKNDRKKIATKHHQNIKITYFPAYHIFYLTSATEGFT